MKIALFSDVHGRLRVLLHVLRNWQITHGEYLDAVLIAGDLGCFPDIAKLDKPTRRWMDADPEEAGFSRFFIKPHPAVSQLFCPQQEQGDFSDVKCPILFVPGNHEDFDFLTKLRAGNTGKNTFPVDCYQKFHCIQDGSIITITGNDGQTLQVAGIWGIENTRPQAPYKIKESTIRRLEAHGAGKIDLLLTHDAPTSHPLGGSPLISRAIQACKPRFHIFGHVHLSGGKHFFQSPNSQTTSVIFKDVAFGKNQTDNLASTMGILEWDGAQQQIEIVSDTWLKQMNYRSWEQIVPAPAIAV